MLMLKSKHRIYAAHFLKDQGGRCENLHGHQYEIILYILGSSNDLKNNMIIDTYKLDEIFENFIGVDHLFLNDFMQSENPTMEEMSMFFFNGLKNNIPNLYSVEVYETPENSVIYSED